MNQLNIGNSITSDGLGKSNLDRAIDKIQNKIKFALSKSDVNGIMAEMFNGALELGDENLEFLVKHEKVSSIFTYNTTIVSNHFEKLLKKISPIRRVVEADIQSGKKFSIQKLEEETPKIIIQILEIKNILGGIGNFGEIFAGLESEYKLQKSISEMEKYFSATRKE